MGRYISQASQEGCFCRISRYWDIAEHEYGCLEANWIEEVSGHLVESLRMSESKTEFPMMGDKREKTASQTPRTKKQN